LENHSAIEDEIYLAEREAFSMKTSFSQQLSDCNCCPRKCGINRLQEKTAFCGVGAEIQIAHYGLHFGEEPPISGTKGSGAIFFAGCNLHCVFCQNYQISQKFQPNSVSKISVQELAEAMLKLQSDGAHNINFVSPSHYIFPMADAIISAKEKGLSLPIVYNSNAYDSLEALKLIRGLIDIYLPDIKYLYDELGNKYSKAQNYASNVKGVIEEMRNQVGDLKTDENGIATSGILVRHLVLPNNLENSKQCLKFLAGISSDMNISLMSQYSPLFKACKYPEINRTLTEAEYNEIVDYAISLDLENVFIQELESQEKCLPDFDLEKPFNFGK